MSKELEGYYEGDGPSKTDHPMLNVIFDAIHSHDGWFCPHCNNKSDVYNEEMENDRYMELLHEYTPMKINCSHCYKDYYLKCRMTLKYSTCVDESFERVD